MSSCIRSLAGVCGQYCGVCELYNLEECRGCAYQLGLTLHGECLIFQCCIVEYGLEHCGLCEKFPCEAFNNSVSVDVVRCRTEALLFRRERGTDEWLSRERQTCQELLNLNIELKGES